MPPENIKTKGFLTFSGGVEIEHWAKLSYTTYIIAFTADFRIMLRSGIPVKTQLAQDIN